MPIDPKKQFELKQQLQSAGLLDYNGLLINPTDKLASKDPYEYHQDVWRLYQTMESKDGQIYGVGRMATQAVLATPYTFDYGDNDESPLSEYWNKLDAGSESVFKQAQKVFAKGFRWGISLGAVEWERVEGGWEPVRVIPIPAWWYVLDSDFKPHRIDPKTGRAETAPLPEDTYVLFIYDGDLERPYGRGWLELCYRPYLKKMLIDYNKLEVFQRFINPKAVVTGKDKKQVEDATNDLVDHMDDDVIGLHGEDLELVPWTVDGKGAVELYNASWALENREIAKIIVSSTLVTEEAEYGTRAQAIVQLDPFNLATFERALSLEAAEQELINRWTFIRFAEKYDPPDYRREIKMPEDQLVRAQVDEKLQNMGFEFAEGYIADAYDRPELDIKDRLPELPDKREPEKVIPELPEVPEEPAEVG